MKKTLDLVSGLCLLGTIALTSCGTTKPSRFYALSRIEGAARLGELEGGPRVRLGAVELARYLDRPEIVTREGANRIELAEYDRWAADLKELLTLTLASNLAVLLPSEHVVRFPWETQLPADHVVSLTVGRFDVQDGRAVLEARWGIANQAGEPRTAHLSAHEEPVAGDDYGAIVTALSATLADLSREIADAVREEEKTRSGG